MVGPLEDIGSAAVTKSSSQNRQGNIQFPERKSQGAALLVGSRRATFCVQQPPWDLWDPLPHGRSSCVHLRKPAMYSHQSSGLEYVGLKGAAGLKIWFPAQTAAFYPSEDQRSCSLHGCWAAPPCPPPSSDAEPPGDTTTPAKEQEGPGRGAQRVLLQGSHPRHHTPGRALRRKEPHPRWHSTFRGLPLTGRILGPHRGGWRRAPGTAATPHCRPSSEALGVQGSPAAFTFDSLPFSQGLRARITELIRTIN